MYMKVLVGLIFFDIEQGNIGMLIVVEYVDGYQWKVVLNFMVMMENVVYVKLYFNIFMILVLIEIINEVFEWVK